MEYGSEKVDGATESQVAVGSQQLAPTLPAWAPWSLVILPLVVVGLFVTVQDGLKVNTIDLSTLRHAEPSPAFLSTVDAARGNWASSIFLATVLMVAIGGLGVICVLRSTIHFHRKVLVFISAALIPIVLCRIPTRVIADMQASELTLVKQVSSFDGSTALLYFFAGLFAAAFLIACGLACLIRDASASTADITAVTTARGLVREALSLVAAWLIVGVVGMGLFHRMAGACLVADDAKLLDTVARSSIVFAGAFYTALLVAMFLPAEILLRTIALSHAVQKGSGSDRTAKSWLAENGFELSVVKVVAQVAVMLTPLFAGAVQGLIKLP